MFAPSPAPLFGASGRHETINCDGCGASPITGVRYKCSQCPNFDLCEQCIVRYESNQFQHGNDNPTYDSSNRAEKHLFIRIADPLVSAAGRVDLCNRAASMHNVGCTGCGKQQIIGFRYSCQLCPNVNLCESCEAMGTKHDATHPRVKACQQPVNSAPAPAQASPFPQAGQGELSGTPSFANRVTGGLFGMAHFTSGRDGAFNAAANPFAVAPGTATFGMAHATSGRDGGFGNLQGFFVSPPP